MFRVSVVMYRHSESVSCCLYHSLILMLSPTGAHFCSPRTFLLPPRPSPLSVVPRLPRDEGLSFQVIVVSVFAQAAVGLKSLHPALVVVRTAIDLSELLKLLVHLFCIFILASSAAATGNWPRSVWALLARATPGTSVSLPRPPFSFALCCSRFLFRFGMWHVILARRLDHGVLTALDPCLGDSTTHTRENKAKSGLRGPHFHRPRHR